MEKTNYKLSSTKSGKIAKNNIKKSTLKKIAISSSVLLLSGTFIFQLKNMSDNRKLNSNINEAVISIEPNRTYTDELESMLGVDFEAKYEDDLNVLSSSLYNINMYNAAADSLDKEKYKNMLLDDYNSVVNGSLRILKGKIASDNNALADDITIIVNDDGICARNSRDNDIISLHGDEWKLADKIANFQGYNIENLRQNDSNTFDDDYLNKMNNVILNSIKLVDDKKNTNYTGISK